MTAKVSSLLFGAAVSLVVCGCSPELSKRYSSARFPEPDPARHPVLFSVFTLPVPDSTTAQTISSLSAEGQAEAVKALAAKYTAPGAFLAALAQPLQPASEPAKVVETSSVSRRIVINLVDQAERPAERIQYALVTLYIPAEKDGRLPAKFVSWNAFSTRSETVDYGTTKLKRDFSATANVKTGPIPSYEIGEAGGSATATRSMEEERKITSKFVQSTAVLQQGSALIPFKGNEGFDITDSIAIDVKIEVDSRDVPIKVFNIKELYRDGRPLAPDQVGITMQERRLPATDQVPIPLCASLVYVVRTVDFGDKTVIEGDDSVEFQRRSLGPISATLVPPVKFRTYDLGEHGGSGVSIEIRDGCVESLQLGDFASASELLGWLTSAYKRRPPATPITVAGRPLLLGGNPLSVRDLRRLIVRSAAVSPAAPSQPQDCTPVP